MISTQSGLRRETPLEDFHPHPTAMTDTNTLQQLQNRIAKIERHHEKELKKLKADHDQLEACVRCPKGDKHSAHIFPELTQGESHPRCTVNNTDDLSLSHMHRPVRRITRRHLFLDYIMEVGIPLVWKPHNLERYDETTDLDEHLDAFLTQTNLNTNNNMTLYRVFPTSLKGASLTWYGGPPRVHRQLQYLRRMIKCAIPHQ